MQILISILVFALAVSIKGGLLGNIFTNWQRLVDRVELRFGLAIGSLKTAWQNKEYWGLVKHLFTLPFNAFAKWFLDGSVISLFIVAIYVATSQPSLVVTVLCALSWCLIWSSMGEEAGAAGDYKQWWGKYFDRGFPRDYGLKKGVQYGVFVTFGMSLALGSWCPVIAGATFPLCYFAGNSLYRWHTGKRGWPYSEPIWGAVIGLGYGLAISGYLLVEKFTHWQF